METTDLAARLAALEAEVRRARTLALAAFGLLAAFLLLGQAPARPKIVEANAFVLVDEAGQERAQLAAGKDGAAALVLRHGGGATDARFAVLPDGSIALAMKNPKKSLSLEVSAEGLAALRINEKSAKGAVEASLDGAGRPRVVLLDAEGKAVFKAP